MLRFLQEQQQSEVMMDPFGVFALLFREEVPISVWPKSGEGSFCALVREIEEGKSELRMIGKNGKKTLLRIVKMRGVPLTSYAGLASVYE